MGKKSKENRVEISPEFVDENHLILDLEDWKVFRKKNYWSKLYKKCKDKNGVVDSFCASFSNCSDQIKDKYSKGDDLRAVRPHYIKLVQEAEDIGRRFSASGIEIIPEWKLHKNWFRSMLSQLVMVAGATSPNDYRLMLSELFADLEWYNLEESLSPEYDDITTIHKIAYLYKNDLTKAEEIRHYKVLIEPTDPIPAGSKWLSKSGKIWEVQGVDEKGNIDLEPLDYDEDGNPVKYRLLKLTPKQVFSMKDVTKKIEIRKELFKQVKKGFES